MADEAIKNYFKKAAEWEIKMHDDNDWKQKQYKPMNYNIKIEPKDEPVARNIHPPTPIPNSALSFSLVKSTPNYKYDEGRLLKEFDEYVANTYKGHYVGEDNTQSLDLIFAAKAGWGFCQGNVLKYAGPRLGVKNDGNETRADILKVLHYALLMLYLHDKKTKI